jgi:hypothetical protein
MQSFLKWARLDLGFVAQMGLNRQVEIESNLVLQELI